MKKYYYGHYFIAYSEAMSKKFKVLSIKQKIKDKIKGKQQLERWTFPKI